MKKSFLLYILDVNISKQNSLLAHQQKLRGRILLKFLSDPSALTVPITAIKPQGRRAEHHTCDSCAPAPAPRPTVSWASRAPGGITCLRGGRAGLLGANRNTASRPMGYTNTLPARRRTHTSSRPPRLPGVSSELGAI